MGRVSAIKIYYYYYSYYPYLMTCINSTGTALSPNATESVVRGISDDIIVYDATEEEHDQLLRHFLHIAMKKA